VYFPASVATKFSLPIFALKSSNNIGMSYLQAFHILDLLDHKTHLLLRRLSLVGAYVDMRVIFLNILCNLNLHSLSLRGSEERKLFLIFAFIINPVP